MTTAIADLFPQMQPSSNIPDYNPAENDFMPKPLTSPMNNPIEPPMHYSDKTYPLSKNMASIIKEIHTANHDTYNPKDRLVDTKDKPSLMMYIYVFVSSLLAFNPWLFKLIIYILTNKKTDINIASLAITIVGSLINTLLYYGLVNMYPIQLH